MKVQHISLCFLGTMLFLCSVHARGLRRCLVSMDTHHIRERFQEIKTALQAKDTFQNVTILSTSETLHGIMVSGCTKSGGNLESLLNAVLISGFDVPLDTCCMTKNLLAFYVDRVFKDHEELSPHILRNLSSIANSLLYLQKTLQRCDQKLCPCREEATNKTRVIHSIYDQLEVPSAAIKSLGELDVFLAWIDRNHHQETSTTNDKEPV